MKVIMILIVIVVSNIGIDFSSNVIAILMLILAVIVMQL